MIVNRAMQRLLDAAGPPGAIDLHVELESLLSDLRRVDGCFFFLRFAPERVPEDFGLLQDATGYECSVNSFHIEDYLPKHASRAPTHLALTIVSAAGFLADRLRAHPDASCRFRIIGSIDRRSAVLRFHTLRSDEAWLAADIEGYEQAVFYLDAP